MSGDDDATMEEMYDKAAEIAETHLNAALKEGAHLDYLVSVMMVEAAVNAAVDATSPEDVVRLLKDLTRQIEADVED